MLQHLDAHTSFSHLLTDTSACAHKHTWTDITHLPDAFSPQHQTSILRSPQTHATIRSHLAPHPSPPWRWLSLLTQIQQVTLGQWAVNELILITVNSTTSGSVFLHVCLHACMQAWKVDGRNSRKREVRTSAPSGNQEGLIVRVDRLGWGVFRFWAEASHLFSHFLF